MANKSSEHRMLFDIRGKRKRVVQVVYALLAVLMGLSLFTVVGPSAGFLGDIFGTNSSSNVASVYDDQATRLEAKLRRNPKDEQALLQLTRARFYAAQQLATQSGSTSSIPAQALTEAQKSAQAWTRYIKLHPPHPPATTALLAAKALGVLGATATTASEYRTSAKLAAQAQQIATTAQPTVINLFTLAQAEYAAFDFAAGDKAAKAATKKTPGTQRKSVTQQLAQTRKQAKQQEKQVTAAAKAQGKAGKQQLQQGGAGGLSGGGTGLSGGGLSGAP